MNNINIKLISGNDAYTFQSDLQKYIDGIDTDIFNVEIQYQTNYIASASNFVKTQYSALVILRRKSQ